MKRMQLVSQGGLARMRKEVAMAWEHRDLQKCIEILQRMNRLHPAETSILLELGRMQGLTYNYTAAEESFDRAVRIAAPDARAEVLVKAGQLARDFYHPHVAEKYFRRVIAEPGARSGVFVTLAEICERNRRMEEAHALVEQALRLDPSASNARFAHAHLLNRAGKADEAEGELRRLVTEASDRDVRVRAGYELGAILDRKGRYDEAMQAFLEAKRLLKSDGAAFLAQRAEVFKRVNQMRDQISPAVLRQWFEFGRELQPARRLALLGGHPRSGTTLLEQVVDSHPEIVSMEETDHFQDYVARPLNRRFQVPTPILSVLHTASRDFLVTCRNHYFRVAESCIGSALGNRLLIDKNPSQTLSVPALARAFPEIKFLIALRDPRDVVLSCFMQPMLPLGPVNATWLSLDTAVEEYAGLMGTWRTLAPMLPNPHLEVRYEDMVQDLESVARRVLEFLGVAWDERVLGFDEHARQKRVRSPTYADVTQKVFTRAMGRWRNYQKYLEPHLAKLEPLVKAFGYE